MPAGINFQHFLPAIFASAGLGLSLLANAWCESIKFTSNLGGDSTLKFGVFSRWGLDYIGTTDSGEIVIREECFQYDDVDFDATWKTVKSFAIIAPVIGGILMVWTWVAPCFYLGIPFWRKAGVVYLVVCLFQGLTLLFLQSDACQDNPVINNIEEEFGVNLLFDEECERDWGYNTNIASVVMWFMAGVSVLVVKPPVPPERGPPETQTVTYTQTEQPDGTVAVTETVVKGTYMPEQEQEAEQENKEGENNGEEPDKQ